MKAKEDKKKRNRISIIIQHPFRFRQISHTPTKLSCMWKNLQKEKVTHAKEMRHQEAMKE